MKGKAIRDCGFVSCWPLLVLWLSLVGTTPEAGLAQTPDRPLLEAGKFAEIGSVHEVFRRPIHPYTQGLLASTISVKTTELRSIDGLPPSLQHPPTGCRFHPRCPFVMPTCRMDVPPMLAAGPQQTAACWLHDRDVVAREKSMQGQPAPRLPIRGRPV